MQTTHQQASEPAWPFTQSPSSFSLHLLTPTPAFALHGEHRRMLLGNKVCLSSLFFRLFCLCLISLRQSLPRLLIFLTQCLSVSDKTASYLIPV